MEKDFHLATEILKRFNQEHLLSFYDELEDGQKDMLLQQILNINFNEITTLYKNSYVENNNSTDVITPLPHINKSNLAEDEISYYEQIGINAIKNGELAVVTLSGGSGTRLRSFWTKRHF